MLIIPIVGFIPAIVTFHPVALVLGAVIAITFFFIFGLVVVVMGGSVKRFAKVIEKVNNDECLQKWEYDSDEWRQFAKEELDRRGKAYTGMIKWIMFVMIVVVFVMGFLGGTSDPDFVPLTVAMCVITFLVVGSVFIFGRHREKSWENDAIHYTDKQTMTTYIDPLFVIIGNNYTSFHEMNISLVDVRVENNLLVFTIEIRSRNTIRQNIFVLIPKNQQDRAQEIAKIIKEAWKLQ